MMKRRLASLLAFAFLAIGTGPQLLAHEGHEHKVMGTVTMAAVDHVMLKDKNGKDLTIKVTKDTKVKAKPMVKVDGSRSGLGWSSQPWREGQEPDREEHRSWRGPSRNEVVVLIQHRSIE
jgi:hypothetical protein